MKQRLSILITVLCACCLLAQAQDKAVAADSVFYEYTRTLKTQGNEHYLLSNRMGIRQVISEFTAALSRRKAAGRLTTQQEDSLMQDVWKLEGDYHYENSDFNSASYDSARYFFEKYRDYYQQHRTYYAAGQGLFIVHRELAQLYYKQAQYETALKEIEQAFDMADTYKRDEDEYLDVESQYALCLARVGKFDEALELIDEVVANYENKDTERYGEALRKKAKVLMLRHEQGGTAATDALKCYQDYFSLKKADALQHFAGMSSTDREQYWMRLRPFVTDCYRLEDADAAFLYDVTLFSKGLLLQLNRDGGGTQSLSIQWQQVQQKLPKDGCAIEFIQYEKYGRQQMAALVLTKSGQPTFVAMPSADSILHYKIQMKGSDYTVETLMLHVHGASWDDRQHRNRLYGDSTGLFRFVWHPALLKAIGKSNHVWFAPDGCFHRLAIEYMLPQEAAFTCHRLTSTRRLTEEQTGSPSGKALIIGGVDYAQAGQSTTGNDPMAFQFLQHQGAIHFDYLPMSLEEAQSIAAQRGKKGDKVITGAQATEQQFRQQCADYAVIHISTHGLFHAAAIPQGTDLKPCLSDQSLSESLLAFAGIQHNLGDNTFNQDMLDGALSAKEISSLDLSKASLVVLSCCETGLGYITADGIYGIQRGLKNAGAKAIVVTLWDIDDNASRFFMGNLHAALGKGMTISQSFYQARQAMKDYSEEELVVGTGDNRKTIDDDFSEPSYRDAFILIDATE